MGAGGGVVDGGMAGRRREGRFILRQAALLVLAAAAAGTGLIAFRLGHGLGLHLPEACVGFKRNGGYEPP